MKDHADALFALAKVAFIVEDIAKRDKEMLAKIPIEYAPGYDQYDHPAAGIDADYISPEKR